MREWLVVNILISKMLEETAKRSPNKTALVAGGSRYTYEKVYDDSRHFSGSIQHLGLMKGDRVIVFLENSYEAVVSIYGALLAGGIFIPVNPETKGRKLRAILENSDPRFIVTDRRRYEENLDLLKGRSLIFVDNPSGAEDGTFSFGKMIDEREDAPDIQLIDADIASIIYTSGSTGMPKGVTMTHLSMSTAIGSIITYLDNTPNDIVINVLPMSFDYGLYQVLMTICFGGTLVLEKNFVFFSNLINRIREEKVTGLPLVPAIAEVLLRIKDLDGEDLSSLRYITNTAQKLPEVTIRGLQEKLPHVRIFSMYGLTECKRISYLDPEKVLVKPNSVGKAMPNTEIFLVDEDGRRIETPDTPGELVVRGPNLMKGYWKNDVETAKVLRDGYYPDEKVLFTGDIFRMDEDGDLYFISRKDDVFKIGGEKVSPAEVEDVIYTLSGVKEAAIVRKDDAVMGSSIVAVLSADQGINEDMIKLHCMNNLEKYLVPKTVVILDSLPRNPNGKIDRDLLRERYGR